MLRAAIYLTLATLLVGAILHSFARSTYACSCGANSKEAEIEWADSVFFGMVISIDRQEVKPKYDDDVKEFEDIVWFKAFNVWKGESYEWIYIRSTWK